MAEAKLNFALLFLSDSSAYEKLGCSLLPMAAVSICWRSRCSWRPFYRASNFRRKVATQSSSATLHFFTLIIALGVLFFHLGTWSACACPRGNGQRSRLPSAVTHARRPASTYARRMAESGWHVGAEKRMAHLSLGRGPLSGTLDLSRSGELLTGDSARRRASLADKLLTSFFFLFRLFSTINDLLMRTKDSQSCHWDGNWVEAVGSCLAPFAQKSDLPKHTLLYINWIILLCLINWWGNIFCIRFQKKKMTPPKW
jgi:hypothetical protein